MLWPYCQPVPGWNFSGALASPSENSLSVVFAPRLVVATGVKVAPSLPALLRAPFSVAP